MHVHVRYIKRNASRVAGSVQCDLHVKIIKVCKLIHDLGKSSLTIKRLPHGQLLLVQTPSAKKEITFKSPG